MSALVLVQMVKIFQKDARLFLLSTADNLVFAAMVIKIVILSRFKGHILDVRSSFSAEQGIQSARGRLQV